MCERMIKDSVDWSTRALYDIDGRNGGGRQNRSDPAKLGAVSRMQGEHGADEVSSYCGVDGNWEAGCAHEHIQLPVRWERGA